MGKKQAYKLILKIYGKEFADAFLIKGNTQKVSTQKLGSIQLPPRFHIKAIEYLIEEDMDDDDMDKTIYFFLYLIDYRSLLWNEAEFYAELNGAL